MRLKCRKCGVKLTFENFAKYRRKNRDYICNDCVKLLMREWRNKNRSRYQELMRKHQRKYRKENKEKCNRYQRKWLWKRKYRRMKELGGKCVKCGYDKNISALEFHHVNPKGKESQQGIVNLSEADFQRIKKNLILLCANCHREEHHPELKVSLIRGVLS